MKPQPIVSVIVPTKNSSAYLAGCLLSIKEQTYPSVELIVIDNDSSDATPTIAKKHADIFLNHGPERSAQRNYGARNAKGEYLLIVDSDMEVTPNVIQKCVDKIKSDKQIKAIVLPEESFGVGFWAKCKKLERSFYVGVDWMEAARFFDHKTFMDFRGYDEKNTGTEDYDLPQRIEVKYGKPAISRVRDLILHNEQRLSLLKTCKKKFYYSQNLSVYSTVSANSARYKKQASPLVRYRLFFSQPRKLFGNPIIGIGMLFMKTSEFAAGGAGFARAKVRQILMKVIYHIEFAKTGTGMSGGETCMLELIKYFSDQGFHNILLTTDNGKATYSKILPEKTRIEYRVINSYKSEKKYGVFISYIMRCFQIPRLIKTCSLGDNILLCHSDFLPSSLANWLLLKNNSKVRAGSIYHMRSPSLMKGFEGEFTGKLQLPRPTILHHIITQWIAKHLTPPTSTVFTVNTYYKKYLKAKYPRNKIVVFKYGNGLNVTKVKYEKHKEFDLLWLGRFHRQKGLFEFIEIAKLIKRQKKDIRIAIVGGGNLEIERRVKNKIEELGLTENVVMPGSVIGGQALDYYNRSKVFAMTSYYESYGLVMIEAMSLGIPVVAYYLPVYKDFEQAILKTKLLDRENFKLNVLKLLHDEHFYQLYAENGIKIANEHNWAKTGQTILDGLI